MAKTTSFGYTDTKAANPLSISVPQLDYSKDFSRDTRVSRSGEVILTNVTSPLDQPETLRLAIENVANVYANTQIPTYNRSVTTRGVQLLLQTNDILRVSDAASSDVDCCCDGSFDLPISCHMVIRVPLNQYITADVVMQVAKRNFGMLFDGNNTTARLNQLLRGTLLPPGLG